MELIIKILADYLMLPVVLLAGWLIIFKAPKRGRYDKYARVLMAGLSSYWLAKVVGNLWMPETLRPFEKLHTEPLASYLGNAGFPSDHVLFAMFLTLAVWYVTRKSFWTVVMLLLTISMAVGRVLALVHTPLDVAGGALIALAGAVWYTDYVKKIPQVTLAKKSNS